MENKLRKLFDYQRFENNPRLAKLIEETEARSAQYLSDEDLFFVNAAGEVDQQILSGKDDPFKSDKL